MMTINDTIKQSIDNIPAVKKFSEKTSVRFWKKWGWVPLFGGALLFYISGFMEILGVFSSTTSGLMCLMALITVIVSFEETGMFRPIVIWLRRRRSDVIIAHTNQICVGSVDVTYVTA